MHIFINNLLSILIHLFIRKRKIIITKKLFKRKGKKDRFLISENNKLELINRFMITKSAITCQTKVGRILANDQGLENAGRLVSSKLVRGRVPRMRRFDFFVCICVLFLFFCSAFSECIR